ncbi:hypothetical protein FBU30_005999 [Linnemannia zychae]|nr:hypothetical protein FBU30_005999 [Linnemannia zychae]
MNLEYEDVSRQAQETPYVEEFYDYDAEEEYDDEESNRSQLGGREETSSVTATALTDSATRQATLGSRITPSTAAANSTKATLRSQAQAASPFSPAHDNNKQENEDNSLQRLYHNSHQNTGLNYSHARQQQPSFATIPASTTTPHSHQNNSSTNFNSTVDQRSQHLLHSQGHDRITTHTVDTSATAVSPTDFSPSKDNFVTEKTIHGQSIITADVLSSPEVSPAEMIAQEEKEETVRKRRRARQYTLIRIIFSLGLTILALYWPAGQFKAPIGKLNNASTARDNQPIHGNDTLISNSLPSPTTTSTTPTPTGFIFTASVPEYSHNIAADPNRTMLSVGQRSYYNRHNRKGRQQEPPWCIEEKEFGDDESAVVYCRVKVIRPIVTYVWAVFLVVELCIAAMAGDFSKHGIRRKYPLSFGEGDAHSGYRQDYVLDQQENAEKQVQSSQHGQSVRSLAISESAGVADTNTIVQQQHRQQSSQRSRTENQLVH